MSRDHDLRKSRAGWRVSRLQRVRLEDIPVDRPIARNSRLPSKNEQQKREEDVRKRHEELRRIPLHEIDPTTWPKGVRAISLSEADGLGVDKTGRLYWNGQPVEIVGSRLDLTWTQTLIAFAIAIFTFVAAAATAVQAWTAYRDMACEVGWSAYPDCTTQTDLSRSED